MEPRILRYPGLTCIRPPPQSVRRIEHRPAERSAPGPASGYLLPLAQLNRTQRSSLPTSPESIARRHAASTAPPSGHSRKPSSRAASVDRRGDLDLLDRDRRAAAVAHRAQDQEVADRLGHANAGGHGRRVFPTLGGTSPASNARTIGAQPAAWTAIMRGRLAPISPTASSSSKAFHMPISPVPPPVG